MLGVAVAYPSCDSRGFGADRRVARNEVRRPGRGQEESRMTRSTHVRSLRIAAATALAFAALLPAAIPAAAQENVILQVGTTQDLDSTNPFNTELVVGYEAFQLTYNLLVEF